ncbi:SH3 domain-containing protein [Xanthobacter autotrophicus]|uniref:SH3 domain-containing protein n=1 Tax=Xanthobacter autotrophicus TaxID=280 RepID=UPI001E4C4665|nr:SH3 domain-containing protein [Xanthobacter autotrophicus]UDQ91212.1 SH3 domain-containing protein [Xanthobacter autotrophicus]
MRRLFLLALAAPVLVGEARAEDPTWVAAATAHLPKTLVAGRVLRAGELGQTALIAVFPAGADDPRTPWSAFAPGQVLEVTLAPEGDARQVVSTTVRPRTPQDPAGDDPFAEDQAEILAGLAKQKAEPGVEPCHIRAWSIDKSRKGLAVRAAPSATAKVVGTLAPPRHTPESGQGEDDSWHVEFEITGYKDGWFRIRNATPPGAPYDDPPPRSYPKTYKGAGWIPADKAGGAYANTQMPVMRLHQAPSVDAKDIPPGDDAADPSGNLPIDGTLERLYACSANWALTKSRDGKRGWWRGICSNQVTNCS